MRIAIDLDSTLSYFLESTLEKYNHIYDDFLQVKDVTDWDLDMFLKCSKQQMYELWTPKFIASVPPKKYARKLIDELKSRGHDLVIATAYHRTICEEKVEWCERHLGLNENEIVFIRKKYFLDTQVLIDDGLHNFENGDGMPIKADKIIIDMPYNQKSNHLGKHYRIRRLSEVANIVDLIERNKG